MHRTARLATPLVKACFATIIVLFAVNAHAGFVRYGVSYAGSSFVPAFDGYMLFDDSTPVAGDIWGGIVDWYFVAGSMVFDPGNTVAASTGYFEVDAGWNLVSDFDLVGGPPAVGHAPCFSDVALCDSTGSLQLGFTNDPVFGSVVLLHPDNPGFNLDFGGNVVYSGPQFITVPLPGGLVLFATGLFLLRLRKFA